MITVCHHSASLVIPNGDPRDGFFYPTLTLMKDSYTFLIISKLYECNQVLFIWFVLTCCHIAFGLLILKDKLIFSECHLSCSGCYDNGADKCIECAAGYISRNGTCIGIHILINYMSQCMRFPTMWYVRPAKPQISLCICTVRSEPLLVA